ncbi:MAG: hypothetical protein JW993_10240 [Sedimentisphaerales bacterium]|nr:hypothetical protein [Sedimentisphaerales bacterium]
MAQGQYQYRSSASTTLENVADNRVLIEAGAELPDVFVSPQARLASPGSLQLNLEGMGQSVELVGLSGPEAIALLDHAYADSNADAAELASLAAKALDSIGATASAAQAALTARETPDYQQWLPYIIAGGVLLAFLVKR